MRPECLIVTQCFWPDIGGLEMLMTALADHCAKAGLSVTVLADRVRQNSIGPLPGKPYPIARFGGPRPWRRARKRAYLLRIINQRGADIEGIFADSWKSIEALPRSLECPISVLAHGSEFPPHPSRRKEKRISEALSRCSVVIANSEFTSKLVAPYLGGDMNKLRVIRPPSSPPLEPGLEELSAMTKRIGGRHPVIATIARLEPRKGIDATIRAIPAIRQRHPECVYVIAGTGGDRERLVEIARSLNVQDAIEFLGQVTERTKAALLARSDIFAMPVRREGRSVEGFGLSYSEAAWFGVPSVGGRDGGAAEAILDHETGLICDGEDQNDVTRCLLALLDDAARCQRLGAAARKRVESELSWPGGIKRYLDTLRGGAAA